MPAFSRRDFARLLALSGTAAVLPGALVARGRGFDDFDLDDRPLGPTPAEPDETFWRDVRARFLVPRDVNFLNAANLCPASLPAIEALERNLRLYEASPSPETRTGLMKGREESRKLLAEALRVTPEEIVITRNTSEASNLVSSGLDLKAGDEVLLFSDNHPSNLDAWKIKARRFGFTVKVVDQVNPHPGDEYYLDAFTRQMTDRTKVLGFTHLTSTVGDLFPAKELCRRARERGVLSLVDGAQSLGLIDVDLADMQPDFYAGSGHKWPCGPKEVGVLYVNKAVQPRLWPGIVSAYPGAVGFSKSFESFGQRDEPAIIAFGEALRLQTRLGRPAIQKRARDLAEALLSGLRKIDGVKLWTHPDPGRSLSIVSFQPGSLDVTKLSAALYEKDRIAGAPRSGNDRGGLRFSPHFYNLHSEVERALAAVQRYMKMGV